MISLQVGKESGQGKALEPEQGRGVLGGGVSWGEGRGGGRRAGQGRGGEGPAERSQAVGRPRQHLHGLVQHLEAALPVPAVRVAVEQQPVERGAQRQVVLGTCGRGGCAGAGGLPGAHHQAQSDSRSPTELPPPAGASRAPPAPAELGLCAPHPPPGPVGVPPLRLYRSGGRSRTLGCGNGLRRDRDKTVLWTCHRTPQGVPELTRPRGPT